MCCCLHLRSTCSHVSASDELQIGHVLDGYAFLPKKSCFRACLIYCPVLNFTRHVFCLFVITGLFQESFDNALSMSLLSSHLCSWCVWVAIILRLCFLSYLRMYFPRCRMGPLSSVSCIECHQSSWR
jgi:hypothetical protein